MAPKSANVPFSKVPFSDLQRAPKQAWVDGIVGGLNESMLALSGSPQSYELKVLDLVVPDPWTNLTILDPPTTGPFFGSARLMRHYDGSVQIVASVTGGAAGQTMFTVGTDLAPAYDLVLPSLDSSTLLTNFIIADNPTGQFSPISGAQWRFQVRYMPMNNRPDPLSCFPANIKTKFKRPPKAVVCVKNERVQQVLQKPTCEAGLPSWRYINSAQGPVVQITNIPGLEYGCRQRVTVAIIGG